MITEAINRQSAAAESRALATLVSAFAADPAVRWMYPDAQQYHADFPAFVRAFAGQAFAHSTADVLEQQSAAALWLPPGVQPDEASVVNVLQRSVNEARLPELFSLLEQMGAFHPERPHWYLPLIGVSPSGQGRGCGAALLRRGLARCDEDHVPAYLEATSARSVPLYERFGFKVVGEIKTQTSPSIIPMLRPAQ
jgi:ribosomal protein S18 acetylase RimI-like enzyme